MSESLIQFTVAEGVAKIVLNRPDKMNSFIAPMHAALRAALDTVQADTSIRVLILTGAGRAFCAGQDLADDEMQFTPGEPPPDLGRVVERYYKPLVMQLSQLRVPTIAAVNGVAAGAGASIAMACDLVGASDRASFLIPFSKIGLIPDTGASWHLPRAIGQARAMGLALTARKLTAQQAADWGLIWETVADAAFDSHVLALANQLAVMPTRALVETRAAIKSAGDRSLADHLSFEAEMMTRLGRSDDYIEGVAAFLEKRQPHFKGL